MNILPFTSLLATGPRGPLAREEKSGRLETEEAWKGFKKVISNSFRDTQNQPFDYPLSKARGLLRVDTERRF